MKTEQSNTDSKNIDVGETEINCRKANVNFPLSSLDFFNYSKSVDKTNLSGLIRQSCLEKDKKMVFSGVGLVDKETLSKNICADVQSKGLMTQVSMENDEEKAFSNVVDKETLFKNMCADDQSKGLMTQSYMENDEEKAFSNVVDKETLSKNICADDQSKGLMTQSSVENDEEKVFSNVDDKGSSDLDDITLSDDDDCYLPTYKSLFERIKRQSSQDNLFKSSPGRAMPDKKTTSTFGDNNVKSAGQSAIKCESSDDDESNTSYDSFLPIKSEPPSNIEAKQSEIKPLNNTVLITDKQRVEHSDHEDKSSLVRLKKLVVPPVEQPASDTSDEDMNEGEEVVEEMQLADLQRICYKAMIFQQTGQVPVDCDSDATESYSSCEELRLNPKNPRPCLCRFYCKKKCKKDKDKPKSPVQRPCRVGKGYPSDKRNKGMSSCACKILANSRPNADKKTFRVEIGESSNTKSAGTYDLVIGKNNIVGNTKLKNHKRAGTTKELEEIAAEKYLADLAAKKKLLAKLELSEKRMKRLANYDASLPLFSGIVPVDEDGIQDGSISLSDDDSVHDQKENVAILSRRTRRRNLGAIIDLTSDSSPISPVLSGSYKFNQISPQVNKHIKADPNGENKKQTQTVGRYGVAMGAIYFSDSSNEDDISLRGHGNKRGHKLVKEPLQNSQKSIYISDSDEEFTPVVSFKPSVATTTHLTELPKLSEFKHITRNSLDVASTLNNHSLATESNHTITTLRYHSSEVEQNDKHLHKNKGDSNEQIVTSKNECSHKDIPAPFPSSEGSSKLPIKDHKRALIHEFGFHDALNTNNNNVETSVSNLAIESTSRSAMDWKVSPPRGGVSYDDVLASYAAYDSDEDDRMSFTMESPQSPEYLVNEDPPSPIKSEESEQNTCLPKADEFNPLPSTSATPDIVWPSNRVLRNRTTLRLTQMMSTKRTVKKREVTTSMVPLTPVTNNISTPDQPSLDIPTKRQKGRPRKILFQRPQLSVAMDSGIKKAKVEAESSNEHHHDESTPDRAKLKQEMTAMASELKKVTALAARAAKLEKVAMDAKEKESLALRKAKEVSEKLRAERLEHEKVLKEAKEMAKIEKAEKKRKAIEEEKEKEKAASETRGKTWECPVCLEPRSSSTHLSVTPCGHVFCKPCILEVGQTKGHCPLCNQVFTDAQVTPLFFDFPS